MKKDGVCYETKMACICPFRATCFIVLILWVFCREKEEQSEDFVIPFYTGTDVIQINDNTPSFGAIDEDTTDFVKFSEHDSLGRCGVAEGYIGPDILPTEERGSIGMIKPSGWQTVKYGLKTIHTMTMRFIKPTM